MTTQDRRACDESLTRDSCQGFTSILDPSFDNRIFSTIDQMLTLFNEYSWEWEWEKTNGDTRTYFIDG